MKLKAFDDIKVIYREFYKRHLGYFFVLICLVIMCSMTPLLDTYLNVRLIDHALPSGDMREIMKLLGVFSLIYIFNITAGFAVQVAITKKNNEIVEDMKLCTAEALHNDLTDRGLEEKSKLTVVLSEDIMNVISFMSNSVMSIVIQVSVILTFAVYLIQYSLLLSVITFVFSFIQALAVPIFAKPLKVTSEEFRLNSEEEIGYINSAMTNLKMISIFGRTQESLNRYRQIIMDFKGISMRNLKAGASQDIVTSTVSLISSVLTIGLGAYMIINSRLTLGVFVAFLSLNGTIRNAFATIFSFNSSYQSFRVSAARFTAVLPLGADEPSERQDIAELGDIEFIGCDIERDGAVVSGNINCRFDKGSKNLIIGPNGCGKTSMLGAMCGLLTVDRGMLIVSGSDINDIAPRSLRGHISCCFQDNYFLQDTVSANICTREERNRAPERFDRIIELLGIGRERLGEQLDSCVSGFSGGELQRISIARALMKNSDLYLFDEPFSSIEERKKTELLRGICEFLKEKTVIIISHDREVLEEAERLSVNCCFFEDMIRL